MKRFLIAALLAAAAPVAAQTAPAASVTAPADPARIAIATRIVARLMPPGAYRTIMKPMLDSIYGTMSKQMLNMPVREFLAHDGIDQAEVMKLGPVTIRQIVEILDPAFDRRMKIFGEVMSDSAVEMMTVQEPLIRSAYIEALARRFTAQQLTDVDAFFATPSGNAYASEQMLLSSDPVILERMRAMLPQLMASMPALMKKAADATAGLPPRKTAKDLTPAEKARLQALLGPLAKETTK